MASKNSKEAQRSLIQTIKDEFWYRGDLRYLLRPHGQTWCYNQYKSRKKRDGDEITEIVWNCHRRMGKSFLLLLLALERALAKPHQQIKFAAPTLKQVEKIARPLLLQLLSGCPQDMYPKRRHGGKEWIFKNPRWIDDGVADWDAYSQIGLYGADHQDGDSMRGEAASLVLLDEVGFYANLEYLIDSVLIHQFSYQPEPALVMATSAPISIAHPFFERFVPAAQTNKTYMEVRGSRNPDFTELEKRNVLKVIVGGEESQEYQREVECAKLSDKSQLILPEFQDVRKEIVVTRYKRPAHFWPWAFMDAGFVDHFAILYGYVDFEPQLLVIESCIWVHYKSTQDLARAMLEREALLYPKDLLRKMGTRVRRVGDITPQQLEDFRDAFKHIEGADKGLPIRPVEKYDRDSAIARTRTAIQQRKIRIVSNDTTAPLIYQCEHGIWDDNRKHFARPSNASRSEKSMLGHCDAVAALVYGVRSVRMKENPYPTKKVDTTDKFLFPDFHKETQREDLVAALSSEIRARRRRV